MNFKSKKSYSPYWPETLIFWGAGATASLGMTTTAYLGKKLFILADLSLTLPKRVKKVFAESDDTTRRHIENLLTLLKDEDGDVEQALREELKEDHHGRIHDLQEKYDWPALKKTIRACPGHSVDTFILSDLFNILDIHITGGHGLYITPGEFLRTDQLIAARNALKMLIILIHSVDYQIMLRDKKDILYKYVDVAAILTNMMYAEGEERQSDGMALDQRNYYMFSYGVISMNWDPVFLWLIFNAERKANNMPPSNEHDNTSHIKLYHDLGHFMGIRKIEGETPDSWYPMNEATAQRLNGESHSYHDTIRLGKFYFPHGSHNWRECPSCGRITMYLGNEWDAFTETIVPPLVLPNLMTYLFDTRSKEEEQAHSNNQCDAIQCPFCGTMTELLHTPIIMQSNNQGWHPSFIEEIQRDMRIAIQRAKHIVLLGYSLPMEDVIFRSLLSASKQPSEHAKRCTIITGNELDLDNKWFYGKDIEAVMEKVNKSSRDAINTVIDIFGVDHMRYYGRGIPNVFLNERGHVDEAIIQDILYWEEEASDKG